MTDRLHLVKRALSLKACTGLFLASLTLIACHGAANGPAKPAIPDAVKNSDPSKFEKPMFNGVALYTGPHSTPKGMKGLTIRGYNYTDTYIDSFAVNGAGGGNLEVSRKHAGGGGGTCCASIPGGLELPMTVEIVWKRDGDAPYCKQTVLLDRPVATDPYAFDVHFYQDGTIQVATAPFDSEARVNLERFNAYERKASGNVNNDSKLSRCGP
ncbi:MAG: DUF3304 domain-containing protein [Rhizobacter sp.]|nr:DUF3304 domain-containing protein [Rhizobacter sp.]